MQQLLSLTGNIAAILGILLCAVSGLARVSGLYYLAGYQSTTIFIVGTGLMVFACLVKLEAVLAQQKLN
jgi:type IV secretory pathway VirB2 component (pilin)